MHSLLGALWEKPLPKDNQPPSTIPQRHPIPNSNPRNPVAECNTSLPRDHHNSYSPILDVAIVPVSPVLSNCNDFDDFVCLFQGRNVRPRNLNVVSSLSHGHLPPQWIIISSRGGTLPGMMLYFDICRSCPEA